MQETYLRLTGFWSYVPLARQVPAWSQPFGQNFWTGSLTDIAMLCTRCRLVSECVAWDGCTFRRLHRAYRQALHWFCVWLRPFLIALASHACSSWYFTTRVQVASSMREGSMSLRGDDYYAQADRLCQWHQLMDGADGSADLQWRSKTRKERSHVCTQHTWLWLLAS